ncbi:methyltransferase domain-containing protein [Shewanella aestuarii]|uniref:Class I SAM-dependent methyltransferase n=1 Tax=Shewanella aestuarii TaxID=1028752 RepID=A0A6G9QHB6_9GAMM|nr:class I SAM-dependent methyltransferase [Shewanella aestuarii]QIR13944.1 class I SAM-dependent methyltransferase [Shewanella aestuarii]
MNQCKIAHACEPQKSHLRRQKSGFYQRYLSGKAILDIGGGDGESLIPNSIIVDLDYPGYNGTTLPFETCSQDAVFSSHCLEHVDNPTFTIKEWFRVIKPGGFLVLVVPHQYLYERKLNLPSRWNKEHLRFYTPSSLLLDVESALIMNTYRIRSMLDNDANFDYNVSEYQHATGCYEIELVIEKLAENPVMEFGTTRLKKQLIQQKIKDVIICGAGEIGEDIYRLTQQLNIKVHAITDQHDQQLKNGIRTIKLSSLTQPPCIDFIVASVAYKQDIITELKTISAKHNFAARILTI